MTTFDDRSPIYRQIADRIRTDVLRGTLVAGDQVMSTTQYAAHHRINPATAQKAFQRLADEGVLQKRRGIGMFVTDEAREVLRRHHRERFFSAVVDPMVAEARTIGVPLDDVVARIRALSGREEGA